MVSIYDIKPAFQKALRPVMDFMAARGITPNQVTLLALGLSVAGGTLLVWHGLYGQRDWVLWMMPVLLLVRMALNALDGMLARTMQMASAAGEVLNELGDVLADIALYLPLLFFVSLPWGVVAVLGFVILAVLTEFSGLLAKVIINQRRYDGPMGKSDRAFAVGTYCLLLFFMQDTVFNFSTICFTVLDILLIMTCVNRLAPCMQNLRKDTK